VHSDAASGSDLGRVGETPVVDNSGGRFSLYVINAVTLRGDMRFSFIAEWMNSKKW